MISRTDYGMISYSHGYGKLISKADEPFIELAITGRLAAISLYINRALKMYDEG
jgi:hypothetical protein